MVCVSAFAGCLTPLVGQEIALQRDYPGSGPYACPVFVVPVEPSPEDRARAGQLASDANQAMILGDLERVDALLARSADLDGTSADLAYRHARVLQDLGSIERAMIQFCRALDLDVESIGIVDAKDRLDALAEDVRVRLPEAAHEAFIQGLTQADDSLFTEAIESFTEAMEAAPEWATPLYNRAILYEHIGRIRQGLADFRNYLTYITVDPDAAAAMEVAERIGVLEGVASVVTPSPSGAFALGMVPGMGHYYTGRPVGGTVILSLAVGVAAVAILSKDITTLCVNEVPPGEVCPPELIVGEITDKPFLLPGLGIAAAVTLIGAIDALLKARGRRAEAEAIGAPQPATGPQIGLPTVTTRGNRVELNLLRIIFR